MQTKKAELLLDTVLHLRRRGADAYLKKVLAKSHPSEISSVIRQLPYDDGIEVFQLIQGSQLEAETIVELGGSFLKTFLNYKDKKEIAEILQKLPEDETAHLLSELEEGDAQEILSLMKGETKEEVVEILEHEEDTCGRIMAINVFSLHQNLTAYEAILRIQKAETTESLFYIYVIDDYNNLVGVISLRQLLQVNKETCLKDFMKKDVIRVSAFQKQEHAATLIEEYNFVSLPVIDEDGRLVGMITVNDIIDYIRDEAQEEVLQLAGVEKEAIGDFSFFRALWSRVFWYGFLLLSGLFCSEVILFFFKKIPQEILVLCFIPLILGVGGNIARQTTTFVSQSLLNPDVEKERSWRALWSQNATTCLVGLILSIFVFGYTWLRFFQIDFAISLTFGLIAVTVSSLGFGVFLPLLFARTKADPVTTSSHLIYFLMDVFNLVIFFYVFWLAQRYF